MSRFARHRCFDGVEASPEFAARRLLMAALLYYDFGTNIMSDHEYDALGEFVRDNFNDVPPHLQFCIGHEWAEWDGLSGWTASGASFKITRRVHYSALAWARHCDILVENEREWAGVDYDLEADVEFAKIRG